MEMLTEGQQEAGKQVLDGISFLTVVGSLLEMLPAISAVLSIVWVSIRIWETKTVQNIFNRKKENAVDE
jgi:hypothetical protein